MYWCEKMLQNKENKTNESSERIKPIATYFESKGIWRIFQVLFSRKNLVITKRTKTRCRNKTK
jgi:hypothetical protein